MVDRQIAQIIKAIEDGMHQTSMRACMDELEARKAILKQTLVHADKRPALIHPTTTEEYWNQMG